MTTLLGQTVSHYETLGPPGLTHDNRLFLHRCRSMRLKGLLR